MLSRRHILSAAGIGAAALLTPRLLSAQPVPRRPNIIVILTDDQGYVDAGCYGSKDLHTPHIDALAAAGVRFTDGYVSAPICAPTRAGLLTGRYQQRFGVEFNPPSEIHLAMPFGLPLTEHLLPEFLRAGGYATGMVGKWHLGLDKKFHPLRRGFDEFFGFLHGSHSYITEDPHNPIMRGYDQVDEPEYLTDAFTREALSFIDRHQHHPFFLYLPYNAPHEPMEAPLKYVDRVADIQDPGRRAYAAMMAAVDDGVGAIMKKLEELKLDQDTLVIFLSDNGGFTPMNSADNGPLKLFKGNVFEGGIRVPFIVRWAGHLPAGAVYRQPASSLDIFPTVLAAAGLNNPPQVALDGVNLLPYLTGQESGSPHQTLYWRYGRASAVREGKWKLDVYPNNKPFLYDLETDLGEQHDIAAANPRVVAGLLEKLQAWDKQLAKPLWASATFLEATKKK